MRVHANLRKRLGDVRDEMARLRDQLSVLDEQIAHQQGVADEAATRAVVSSTPLADRERRIAEDDLRRTQRQREETGTRLAELNEESDALLDRLLAQAGGDR